MRLAILYIILLLTASPLFSQIKPHWSELPKSSALKSWGLSAHSLESLQTQVDSYHTLSKNDPDTLLQRIARLDELSEILDTLLDRKQREKRTLLLFQEMVQEKALYLTKLKSLATLPFEKSMNSYHYDTSDLQDKTLTPLFLRNETLFSLQRKEYWGAFWWETLDPCHRRLAAYLHQWQEHCAAEPSPLDFFLWLEEQHLPESVVQVAYFTSSEAQPYHASLVEGKLFQGDSSIPMHGDPNKRYILSIDLNKQLFIAESSGAVWHSSFTSGRPVLAAGVVKIIDGIICSYSIESGHYFPALENGYQALQLLAEMGATFSHPFEICFFRNGGKHSCILPTEKYPSYKLFLTAVEDAARLRELSNMNLKD